MINCSLLPFLGCLNQICMSSNVLEFPRWSIKLQSKCKKAKSYIFLLFFFFSLLPMFLSSPRIRANTLFRPPPIRTRSFPRAFQTHTRQFSPLYTQKLLHILFSVHARYPTSRPRETRNLDLSTLTIEFRGVFVRVLVFSCVRVSEFYVRLYLHARACSFLVCVCLYTLRV